MSNIIVFDSVTKRLGNTIALNNVSFRVPEGRIVGLIGANGAGKTTALRHIIRYLRPDSGKILYDGNDLFSLKNTSFPVSYIPDAPVFYEELSVLEHLVFVSTMYQTRKDVSGIVEKMDLERDLDKVPSVLSKGAKQKLMIACALLRRFGLLIGDEPFSGLDPKQIRVLKDTLLEQKEIGKTVMISSHLLAMIEDICDYYILLDRGVLIGEGSKEVLMRETGIPSLEAIYMRLVGKNADTQL